MRNLSLLIVALVALSASAAQAQEFRAKDGSVLSVYGGPGSEEWEASTALPSGEVEDMCDVSGGATKNVFVMLYCDPDDVNHVDLVTRAKGGVTFRGKFYAHVKQ